jgi:hypothetical protein
MSDNTKQTVNTSSAEFNEGLEAGLNSTEDTKNWQAGNELGQELKDGENKKPLSERFVRESSTSLLLGSRPKRKEGNLQDEKDETEE